MPLTDRSRASCRIVRTEPWETFAAVRVCVDTGSGAAGVRGDTRSASARLCGYASRCMPLLNPWRRMIFNRLE
jgi:hypothetical protein